jgi:hypothetical protein
MTVNKKLAKIIKIGNTLIVETVDEVKEKWDNAFPKAKILSLDSPGIQEIDLAGIQFIQYCLNESQVGNKQLEFHLTIESKPKDMLIKSGFTNIVERAFT